jgi:hypothetical protein
MTRTPVTILVLNLGRRSEMGREKRVTPEFGERKEEKILPPNSARYTFAPHVFSQLVKVLHFHGENCWGEGEDATLRSRPSPWSPVQRRQDNGRGHPSLHSTSGEGLQQGHPTVRLRPAWRPTCDPAHCNRPCVATSCYGPKL